MTVVAYVLRVEMTTGWETTIGVDVAVLVNVESVEARVQVANIANNSHSSWHSEQIQLPSAFEVDTGIESFAVDSCD